MKAIIAAICLSLSFSTFSAELSCSQNGTVITYINGIFTIYDDAVYEAERAWELAENSKVNLDSEGRILKDLYHNYSYGFGDYRDLMEAAVQFFQQNLPNDSNQYKMWSYYLRFDSIPPNIRS